MTNRPLSVVAALMLVGVAACGTTTSPQPEASAVVDTTVAFPNLLGVSGEIAQDILGELFPNGGALIESRDAYEYKVANGCLWRDPSGSLSFDNTWPVTSVVRFLNPETNNSPTEPVVAGMRFDRVDRLYFELHTEKPADVWCQPYDDPGSTGGAPNVGVPNDDEDGESWVCRRHRWC
ncbi:hypothetical protein GS433_17135 [Rhodococcus hoagii]|uniref:hypothetical protein n=1 Tax=Rhodococcus hoagii TaxID=43767 RepID=UPI00111C6AAF|nr:hypothetical protein [Prescottella equi]MBM4536120.1 hypothetical protein [Prescottella equi]NKR81283.1 hypothetical protein [Prescottella equi]